jgi:hypothetical protein
MRSSLMEYKLHGSLLRPSLMESKLHVHILVQPGLSSYHHSLMPSISVDGG